jgi:hypothetical protein
MQAAKLPRKAIRLRKEPYVPAAGPLPEAYLVVDDEDSLRPGGLETGVRRLRQAT